MVERLVGMCEAVGFIPKIKNEGRNRQKEQRKKEKGGGKMRLNGKGKEKMCIHITK